VHIAELHWKYYKYLMRINELILELSFQGSPCTKDCSGHMAGYNWAQKHPMTPAASPSKSFNNGAGIAANQSKPGVRPKIRNAQGKFASHPIVKPKRLTPTVPRV